MSKNSTPISTPTTKPRKSTLALIGQKFGRLTVIGLGAPAYVKAECECGTVKEVKPKDLRKGVTSCGCRRREMLKTGLRKSHGMRRTPIYGIWCRMLARCNKPSDSHYKDYGARGIKVCERWHTFENFHADMGDKPEGLTLDRIDNSKGYSPENCRWATMKEQGNNRRSNVLITARGKTLTVKQWSEITGASVSTIHKRIRDGFDGEQAIAKGYVHRGGAK